MKRPLILLAVFALVLAACTTAADSEDVATTTTEASEPTTTEGDSTPALSPAEVVFEAQESDGTTIVVASITLPSPGFIAVHSNADGHPGPVIGHSDLLPAGTTENVEITLDTPLEATDLVFPMAHIDVNENGEYEFFPPDNVVDFPATTADDAIAVVGAELTVLEAATGPAMSPAEVVFEAQESDGTTIVVASITLPSPGFIAVHSNADGHPGPVIGHSDLLPAGTTENVEITLDTPLEATDLVFPMAHIDVNENGEYEFFPPDNVVDLPATTADDAIAVVGAEVTVG